jgi:hypothetical protein
MKTSASKQKAEQTNQEARENQKPKQMASGT